MSTDDSDLSPEARDLAADAMIRAATAPQPARIGEMAAEALSGERDLSPEEIRALASTALSQAQKVNRLMIRLADLLEAVDGQP